MRIENLSFDLGTSLQIIGGTEQYGQTVIEVQPGSEVLCITVTSAKGLRDTRSRAFVRITSPLENRIQPTIAGVNGQQTYLIENPQSGDWKISVEGDMTNLEINASAVKKGWANRIWNIYCKACIYGLRAIIIAVLHHLLALTIFPAILEILRKVLGLATEAFNNLIDFILEMLGFGEKVDDILKKICRFLGYCD